MMRSDYGKTFTLWNEGVAQKWLDNNYYAFLVRYAGWYSAACCFLALYHPKLGVSDAFLTCLVVGGC